MTVPDPSARSTRAGAVASGRFLRVAVFVLALLITLVAFIYGEENIRGKRAWNSYLSEQRAKGEKCFLTEFIPPAIPDEKNLALCPLLKPVLDMEFRTISQGKETRQMISQKLWTDPGRMSRLSRLGRTWSVSEYHAHHPSKNSEFKNQAKIAKELMERLDKQPLTNGWIDLAGWQQYYLTGTNLVGITSPPSPAHGVLLALRDLEPDLAELEQEAARRPLARWPIFYDTNAPWGILLPHLARVKSMVTLLQLRCAARLACGETEGAFADLNLGYRLAESVRDEPTLISQMVRNACHGLLLQPLKEGLARHQFSEAQLAVIQQNLAAVDLLAAYSFATKAERAFNSEWNRYATETGNVNWSRLFGDSELGDAFNRASIFARYAPSGWVYQNQLALFRLIDQFALRAVDVSARRVYPEIAEGANEAARKMNGPFSVFPKLLFVPLSSLARKLSYGQTQLDQAVIACALERYHLAKGAYPDSLETLAPPFIESIPHDLFTGQALQFHRTEGGHYVLASVGWPNKPAESQDIRLRWFGSPEVGDWEWRLPGS